MLLLEYFQMNEDKMQLDSDVNECNGFNNSENLWDSFSTKKEVDVERDMVDGHVDDVTSNSKSIILSQFEMD